MWINIENYILIFDRMKICQYAPLCWAVVIGANGCEIAYDFFSVFRLPSTRLTPSLKHLLEMYGDKEIGMLTSFTTLAWNFYY